MLVLPLYYCILSKKSPKESHTSKKLGRGRRNTDAIVGQDSTEKKGEHHHQKSSAAWIQPFSYFSILLVVK